MPDAKTTLTRTELFDLVWSKPATKVAADYGVSSVAVAKACRRLDVPTPPRGYWTQLAHGKVIPRPTLGSRKPGERESTSLGEGAKISKSAEIDSTVTVDNTPAPEKPHPIVQKTRAAFRGGAKDSRYGTLYGKRDIPHLRVSVTPDTFERAIEILNRLAWMLERNGFVLEEPKEGSESVQPIFVATKTKIDFSVQEVVERYERELTAEEKKQSWTWDRWRYRPTGRLKIVLAEYEPQGARKSWSDGKVQKLDEKLTEIVEGFIICAQGKHAAHLKWEAQRQQWAEEARRREEAERQRQEEEKRRNLFRESALRWREANLMREFRAACEAKLRGQKADGTLTADEEAWLLWADSVVDRNDPLKGSLLERSLTEWVTSRRQCNS
ncbi:hypothetical protein Oter_1057 [Opitutus terrae PB90-1]|uniref:Uncharacterized protein n=1 Tax=Opitutus terrae (strain DSM 11246 / JCM 15787 / PB90-1) TaxID=452637 RepID=B1ZMK0_OPITP|nr:hypothetical protein Oter_1057 [Opitutus terrae PB90-1]